MATLQQMMGALSQMQSGWGGFAAPTFAQPSVPAFAQQQASTAPGSANSRTAYASPQADLQRYINAVDNSGGVNSARLGVGEVGEYQARSSLVNGYASEVYAGGRISDVNTMARHQNTLYHPFHLSTHPFFYNLLPLEVPIIRHLNYRGGTRSIPLAVCLVYFAIL